MLSQILTFAINVGNVKSKSYYEGAGATEAKNICCPRLNLEVVKGERTGFTLDYPDLHYGYGCSFYDIMQKCKRL